MDSHFHIMKKILWLWNPMTLFPGLLLTVYLKAASFYDKNVYSFTRQANSVHICL